MNRIESFIYGIVRKNPTLKQGIRNIYQECFDLLPRKKEFFKYSYQFKEGYFFGFHDISPFSANETSILANQLNFDLRMPMHGEYINVGYFDFTNGELGDFHALGKSYAWNYHKGCRLQWLDTEHIIFNTATKDCLESKIVNIITNENISIGFPIDSIYSTSGKQLATSFSYERLERCMPGYGYPYADNGQIDCNAPDNDGLFLVDLTGNTRKLLVSLAQLAEMNNPAYLNSHLHFVTHTEFSRDGRYIAFLYRRIPRKGNYMRRLTQLMVYDLKTEKLITLPSQESGSHYVWNHKQQLLASCILNGTNCHVLFDMNRLPDYSVIAGDTLNSDGHQSFISDMDFVTDMYPDKYRMAKLFHVNIENNTADLVASVYSPKEFQTKDFKCHIACDLHPRVSPSGKYLCFDSPRTGKRALYVMNLY